MGKGGEGEGKNLWPSRMKDLIPLPRPVEFALPPRATVSADKAALLPPEPERACQYMLRICGRDDVLTPVMPYNKSCRNQSFS